MTHHFIIYHIEGNRDCEDALAIISNLKEESSKLGVLVNCVRYPIPGLRSSFEKTEGEARNDISGLPLYTQVNVALPMLRRCVKRSCNRGRSLKYGSMGNT